MVAGVLTTLNSLSASAEGQISAQDLTNKTLLNAIKTCYTDKYMKSEIDAKDYYSFKSLFTKDGTKDGVINVPTMVGNTLNDSNISCEEVFFGYRQGKSSNSITGLFSAYGKASAAEDLWKLGFKDEKGENPNGIQEGCFGFVYTRPDPNSGSSIKSQTNQLCFQVSGDPGQETIELLNDNPATDRGGADGPVTLYYNSMDQQIYISTPQEVDANIIYKWQVPTRDNWATAKQDFQEYVEGNMPFWINSGTQENLGYHLDSMTSTELGETTYFDKYVKEGDNGLAGALRALRYINSNGGTVWKSIEFTNEDIYSLYLQYYNNTASKYTAVYTGDCYATEEEAESQSAYYIQNSDKKWCTVYGVDQVTEEFNLVSNKRNKLLSGYKFSDVIKYLAIFSKLVDVGAVAPEIQDPTTGGENGGATGGDTTGDTVSDVGSCFTNASSLGWIICPVAQIVGHTVQGVYSNIRDNFLQIDSSYISTESGTYEGWNTFRNFANIFFAIILIIIILSQVTGIGVSNYGIKKTLPTLIIVAVLVNLSFFLCQILVDISNITGYWLEDFLKNLTVSGGEGADEFGLGDLVGGLTSTLLTGSGTVLGATIAVKTWEIWLLPFVLALLVSLIGVLFFYILLAARQAIIIILIVISPLAFICYALPNTKKLFDRWWKIFSALLILYPICGALMGGGIFASRLLIKTDTNSFFFKLVAVLLQVVPFFFIPTLLRSAFSALGALGMRVSNFGRNLGQRINRGISNSQGFRDLNRRLGMNNALRSYNRISSGRGTGNRLSRGLHRLGFDRAGNAVDAYNRRRSAQYMDAYRKGRLEDIKADVGSYPLTEREESALRDQIQMEQLEGLAKAYESDYRNSGRADDEPGMILEHASALATLRANPNDREAQARIMGIHNILKNSDPGRTGMQNNLYAAALDMQKRNQTSDEGVRFASSHMLRNEGAMYKAKNKGFHSFLVDAAQNGIKFNRAEFADGPDGVNNSYYDGTKISSWSGPALAAADEGALDRLLTSAEVMNTASDAYAQLSNMDKQQADADRTFLDQGTRDALTNPNIELQPKIRQKINSIRTRAGLEPIAVIGQTEVDVPHGRGKRKGKKGRRRQ